MTKDRDRELEREILDSDAAVESSREVGRGQHARTKDEARTMD